MYLNYFIPFLASLFLAIIFTLVIRKWAIKQQIIDRAGVSERKIHLKSVPLMGGLAIFIAFFIVLGYYAFFTDYIIDGFKIKNMVGIFIGAAIIMIGGFLDDKYSLKPKHQIIFPVLAVLVVIASGIGISKINNPLGGIWYLDQYEKVLFWSGGVGYKITLLADAFTLLWLMGMMYTTKFLDGLDGLVSGIVIIGAVMVFLLSLSDKFFQPHTAYLAIILVGTFLGFLFFNFHPARIFLGEGGSLLAGFMLGILAIIFGSKIATTLLVMGIPILDVIWVILRRSLWEKKTIIEADKKHLHFRLLDVGFSHRQAVLFLYFLAASFGALTLFLQTKEKFVALGVLVMVMVVIGVALITKTRGHKNTRTQI